MSFKSYGAAGFAAGGLVAGLSGDLMLFAFILFGFIGSTVLSIPAHDKKLTILSALAGSLSFFIGFTVPMFISLSMFSLGFLMVGVIMGLAGGTALGVLYRNVKGFILAGVVGFGIWGALIDLMRPLYHNIHPAIVMMAASAIAGAFLGSAAQATREKADT